MSEFLKAFESLIAAILNQPSVAFIVLIVLYMVYQRSRPFPEFEDTKVISLRTEEQFEEIVSKLGNKQLVIDFYAKWCPPCKSAAPVFHAWANTYDPDKIVFSKVDVDASHALAKRFSISAMPTFMVFNSSKKELSTFVGWRQSQIESYIKSVVEPAKKTE